MQRFCELTEEQSDDLNTTLKLFWDLETMGITRLRSKMTFHESVAWHKVSTSIQFEDGHCVVAVPWRDERPSLPNNRPLAEKHLESTERKLERNSKIADAYQKVTEEYLEKSAAR